MSDNTLLKRTLGLSVAFTIVVGSMIGSGIFRKPSVMALNAGSLELVILVWIIAGIITLIGALSCAEIGSMIPKTGGQYEFFRHAFGEFVAFLYGWSTLAIIQTGSQAAMAYAFAEYLGYFYKIDLPYNLGVKSVAILLITFFTLLNISGTILGGKIQNLFTFTKLLLIFGLIFILFGFGNYGTSNILMPNQVVPQTFSNIISGIGLALAGAFWAYDGWNNLSYVAGEIKKPQINIPRSLIFGTLTVISVYLLFNLAIFYVLPFEVVKNSPLVASTAMEAVLGPVGGTIIAIMVMISVSGSLNGSILTTARVQYAMAKNKQFFKILGSVHPRFQTPHISLIVQGVWASILVISGSFDSITDTLIFASWLFYALGVAGVIVLRKKMPNEPRSYKVPLYPLTPILFILFAAFFLINSIIAAPISSLCGLGLVLIGVPIYFYYKKEF